MNNLTLLFHHLDEQLLGKDVFLVPYYLAKRLGVSCTIVYHGTAENNELPDEYRGVKLVRKEGRFILGSIEYVFRNARNIDYLMLFHYTWRSNMLASIYKGLNSKGKIYLKTDASLQWTIDPIKKDISHDGVKGMFYRWSYRRLAECVDSFTCETSEVYNEFMNLPFGTLLKDKMTLMPNGFDEELRLLMNVPVRGHAEKENLIITVGRLGTEQKNTEMLLQALGKANLANWKVHLIGSVEPSFQTAIDVFYVKYPNLKDIVRFNGPIGDKKELWNYYSRAKVFLLTSIVEGFCLVLHEAFRFENYIVSTDLSCAHDIIEGGKYGRIIPQNDADVLAKVISEITSGKNVDVYQKGDAEKYIYENTVKRIKL